MNAARLIGMLLLYVWVTVGTTVATHYCAGEPVSASMLDGSGEASTCCCGEQEPMEGCCETLVVTIRLGDAHTPTLESSQASLPAERPFAAADHPLSGSSPHILPAVCVHPPGAWIPAHILDSSLLI